MSLNLADLVAKTAGYIQHKICFKITIRQKIRYFLEAFVEQIDLFPNEWEKIRSI